MRPKEKSHHVVQFSFNNFITYMCTFQLSNIENFKTFPISNYILTSIHVQYMYCISYVLCNVQMYLSYLFTYGNEIITKGNLYKITLLNTYSFVLLFVWVFLFSMAKSLESIFVDIEEIFVHRYLQVGKVYNTIHIYIKNRLLKIFAITAYKNPNTNHECFEFTMNVRYSYIPTQKTNILVVPISFLRI